MSLGDAVPGGDSDALYTGDYTPDNPLTLDYYREKARQFQDVLTALDNGARAARSAIEADLDESLTLDLQGMLDEFDSKRGTLVATAEAINLGAQAVNAMGGRFPNLSIPSGLGFLPALPVAAVAAIGVAAALIAWGVTWLNGLNARLKDAQLLAAVQDPDKRAALADAIQQSDAAVAGATESPLSSIASLVKWGVIAAIGFVAWKTFMKD